MSMFPVWSSTRFPSEYILARYESIIFLYPTIFFLSSIADKWNSWILYCFWVIWVFVVSISFSADSIALSRTARAFSRVFLLSLTSSFFTWYACFTRESFFLRASRPFILYSWERISVDPDSSKGSDSKRISSSLSLKRSRILHDVVESIATVKDNGARIRRGNATMKIFRIVFCIHISYHKSAWGREKIHKKHEVFIWLFMTIMSGIELYYAWSREWKKFSFFFIHSGDWRQRLTPSSCFFRNCLIPSSRKIVFWLHFTYTIACFSFSESIDWI